MEGFSSSPGCHWAAGKTIWSSSTSTGMRLRQLAEKGELQDESDVGRQRRLRHQPVGLASDLLASKFLTLVIMAAVSNQGPQLQASSPMAHMSQ